MSRITVRTTRALPRMTYRRRADGSRRVALSPWAIFWLDSTWKVRYVPSWRMGHRSMYRVIVPGTTDTVIQSKNGALYLAKAIHGKGY